MELVDDDAAHIIHLSNYETLQDRLRRITMGLDVPTLGCVDDQAVDGGALWANNFDNAFYDKPAAAWQPADKEIDQIMEDLCRPARLVMYSSMTNSMTPDLQELRDELKNVSDTPSTGSDVESKAAFTWAVGRAQLLDGLRRDSSNNSTI
jgi:hypothetical protein